MVPGYSSIHCSKPGSARCPELGTHPPTAETFKCQIQNQDAHPCSVSTSDANCILHHAIGEGIIETTHPTEFLQQSLLTYVTFRHVLLQRERASSSSSRC